MPTSGYLGGLRARVGNALLLMPSVTGIVYDTAGRILLALHSETDLWVAPGGSIEPNESPADAVVRELWEETGLAVVPTRVIGVYGGPEFEVWYRNGDRVTYVMTVFECQVLTGTAQADKTEIRQVAYWATSEIANLAISDWLRVLLPDLERQQAHACFKPPTWQPPP